MILKSLLKLTQSVLGSLHYFFRNIFSGTLLRRWRFTGNFKTSIYNTCFWILFTYLFSINNQLLTNIYYLRYWKMSEVLCLRLFHILQNILLKYKSLYACLQIILRRLQWKLIQQNFYWRKRYLWDNCNKSKWA